MPKFFKVILAVLLVTLVGGAAFATWYWYSRSPQRGGEIRIPQLSAPVTVSYDERGVPHIQAHNEIDMYRALGYVHAQDRLFQMEIARRLARGELSEILGEKLLETDQLFRTLGLHTRAIEMASRLDNNQPATQALLAYLDGVNHFQATNPPPLEFDVLGIPQRPFTSQDTFAITGYLAYSFGMALRTDPILTTIRDTLGVRYLEIFDTTQSDATRQLLNMGMEKDLWYNVEITKRYSQLSHPFLPDVATVLGNLGIPLVEGSNAWVVAGQRTASGKPLLAGDPHIAFAAPSIWYEAHLTTPDFDLYGHFQALNPMALLGHNQEFGWSLTMFENDDMDLIAEKTDAAHPQKVQIKGEWVALKSRQETIKVKGKEDVKLTVYRSPHGPIVKEKPVTALWWAFLETENPVLQAFYELNRANTRDKGRAAAEKIHAPGLNIVWANTEGDIAWWAAAKLPIRPEGVKPHFVLDGSTHEADKLGFHPFNQNPQEENPDRGYIVSANHQPPYTNGLSIPGYYTIPDRALRIDATLRDPAQKWDTDKTRALQLDSGTGYAARILEEILPSLALIATGEREKSIIQALQKWQGDYPRDSMPAVVFQQLLYEILHAAMADELGEEGFKTLLRTFSIDHALPRLIADSQSPWWNDRYQHTLRVAWTKTLNHLESLYGRDPKDWKWGSAHTLTHVHPLGMQKPLDKIFNVGPFEVAGGRETPNNLNIHWGAAPWPVKSGPSTRRIIDFASPEKAIGINPVGQSGVFMDAHYADQALLFAQEQYVPQHLSREDVKKNTRSVLVFKP